MIYVRAYNGEKYYKSMVYAMINTGYNEKYVLFNPYDGHFEIVRHYADSAAADSQYAEYISGGNDSWDFYTGESLRELNEKLQGEGIDVELDYYGGIPAVAGDLEFLVKLFVEGSVHFLETTVKVENPDGGEWIYINTQADADKFTEAFAGFHDARIAGMKYECGDENQSYKSLTVTLDNSGWFGVAELCFEGVYEFHVVTPCENATDEMFDATLLVRDEFVFWASEIEDIEDDEDLVSIEFDGSFVKALSLKWRKVG